MNNILIKSAGLEDLITLQQIGRQTFSETFAVVNTEENMRQYLDEGFALDKLSSELLDENSLIYFALIDGKVIGYLKVNFGSSQTEIQQGRALEIERIYVLKAFHGKKVAQELYQKAVAIAREKMVTYIWLGVWEQNARAISFYTKNGFVAFDKHIFKLGKDEQTDIMMKLYL